MNTTAKQGTPAVTLTPFAIRTSDIAWIKRNNATVRPDGWVFFDVPASQVTFMMFCGNDFLRYTLPDLPRDFPNRHAMTPAAFVPETARLVGASTELSADTLARMAETAAWKAGAR